MHELDEVDGARRVLLPALDRLLTPFGLYAENAATAESYALTLPGGVEAAEKALHDVGLLRNGMAGYKTLEPFNVPESGSWAWRYDTDDPEAYRWFGKRQLHLTMFEVGGEAHVFAHDELNPWAHPVRHYRGDELDVERGIRDARMLLIRAGVSYKTYPDIEHELAQA